MSIAIRHNCLGLGDAICLTPVFRELRKLGHEFIGLECSRYKLIRDLYWGNPDIDAVVPTNAFAIEVRDVETYLWDYEQTHKMNMSKSRPQLFLDALGIRGFPSSHVYIKPCNVAKFSKQIPEDDKLTVFLQCDSGQSYKRSMCEELNRLSTVLHNNGYRVITATVDQIPIDTKESIGIRYKDPQEAVAIFSLCDIGIGYDSFYLHLSAALHKPFLAILGPTTCTGRTSDYPFATYMPLENCDAPCWRNIDLPCKQYSGQVAVDRSKCLDKINVDILLHKLSLLIEWIP